MKQKTYDELTFADDFLFCKILSGNMDLAKELIERILGIRVRKVRSAESQRAVKFTPYDHGVRFDVYLEDDADSVYDMEIQTTDNPYLAKRGRYYQGMIDLDTLQPGEDYSKLRKSYVVMICTKKPKALSGNRPIYTFRMRCEEDHGIALNDDCYRVFVNAEGDFTGISPELKNFLEYLRNHRPTDEFTNRLESHVDQARISEKWRMEYMTLSMKLSETFREAREEGLAEGRAEGRAEGLTEGVFRAVSMGMLTLENASALLEKPVAVITEEMKERGFSLPEK